MLDVGVPYPGQLPPPEGFERVSWGQAAEGDEVYIACLDPEARLTSRAQGPYRVLARYSLADAREGRGGAAHLQEPGERLLRRLPPSTTSPPPPG